MSEVNTTIYGLTPYLTTTVDDFVLSKNVDEITYRNYSLVTKCSVDENIEYAYFNILTDYLPELKAEAKKIVMTDKEYAKYKYKPKLLAFDIYGSTELYFVIMALNDMCNIRDFNRRKVKLVPKITLINLLREIYSAETNYIDSNRFAEEAKVATTTGG